MVYTHWGGFRIGDKTTVAPTLGKALLKAGYAVVSVGYRLSGEATFPAAVQDAKAALRFVRANAVKYQLDPNRFAALETATNAQKVVAFLDQHLK